MPGRKPRITGDDIARDQGVLEVEDGEVTVFGQHILADPLVAVDRRPLARLHLEAGHLDRRRQLDVVGVVGPVDRQGIHVEVALVRLAEAVP